MPTTEGAMDQLKSAMRNDESYAWSWHCNLACCLMDEGVDRETANRAADRFMKLAFDVKAHEPKGGK